MKKIKILLLLSFLSVLLCGILPTASKVNAATKPSVKKKNVVIYEDASPYKIEFKNLKSDAKIKYSSSDKKIVKIKNSKIVPVDIGEAVVTAKVTQDGNTYKLKINFSVVEAVKKKQDYDKLAAETIKNLKSMAEKVSGSYTASSEIATSKKEAKNAIYSGSLKYTEFTFFVSDFDCLSSEKEYVDLFPWVSDLKFTEVLVYNESSAQNKFLRVRAKIQCYGLFSDERYIIDAIESNDTSNLNSTQTDLYNKVFKVAKTLKDKDEYTTVKNIHDYLVLNLAYPSSWTGDGVHTLDFAVNRGLCVCDGYSKYFYFLCRACGIDCVIVSGDATNSKGKTESHAWNKVKIGKKWYSVDVTWDDPYPDEPGRLLNNYFLLTDDDIAINHKWNNENLPKARFTDLGTLYSLFKGVPRFTVKNEAVQYVQKSLEKAYGSSFRCELKFLDNTGDRTLENIKSLIMTYYNQYNCSYSYSIEDGGVWGAYYEIVIYK